MAIILYRTYDAGGGAGVLIDWGLTVPPDSSLTPYTSADIIDVWAGPFNPSYDHRVVSVPVDPDEVFVDGPIAYSQTGATLAANWHLPGGATGWGIIGNYYETVTYDTPDSGGDPIIYNDYPESGSGNIVSLAVDRTGIAARAYMLSGTLYAQMAGYSGASWINIANRSGKHPSTYWWHGDEHVVYVNGTDSIRDWNVRAGTEATLVTGKHPCVAINPGGSLKALAYLVGTAYKCTVYGGAGNAIGSENTILASGAPDAPGSLAWRQNGDLEFTYSDGSALHTLVSSDLGVNWS